MSKIDLGSREADSQTDQLRLQLADTLRALDSATARREGAEKDLQGALDAVQQAEALLVKAVHRKDAAELVGLASSCLAAFLGAIGVTLYLLH